MFPYLNDEDLQTRCPNQCSDPESDACEDPLSHQSLRESTTIASVTRNVIRCFDEPNLRKWDSAQAGKPPALVQPFTDPVDRRPLVWPPGNPTPARVLREAVNPRSGTIRVQRQIPWSARSRFRIRIPPPLLEPTPVSYFTIRDLFNAYGIAILWRDGYHARAIHQLETSKVTTFDTSKIFWLLERAFHAVNSDLLKPVFRQMLNYLPTMYYRIDIVERLGEFSRDMSTMLMTAMFVNTPSQFDAELIARIKLLPINHSERWCEYTFDKTRQYINYGDSQTEIDATVLNDAGLDVLAQIRRSRRGEDGPNPRWISQPQHPNRQPPAMWEPNPNTDYRLPSLFRTLFSPLSIPTLLGIEHDEDESRFTVTFDMDRIIRCQNDNRVQSSFLEYVFRHMMDFLPDGYYSIDDVERVSVKSSRMATMLTGT